MIKTLLKSGVFWTVTVTILITLTIIFILPYFFTPLEEWSFRLLIGLSFFFTMIVSVLLYVLFLQEKTQKKIKEYKEKREEDKSLSKEVEEKVNDIKIKFAEALKILSQSSLYKNKRRAKYELPWYLMVGKEQEGKTTLLEASGLDFPLNVNFEDRQIKEDSASNNFLWYYAEHAIFIDMPGQYIDQKKEESDPLVWKQGFLKIFAKKRARRPLNGVILNISVDTFIHKSERELEQYGKDLRDRLDELSAGFTASIPIYLIVTKSDKLVGYNEYFSSLSDNEKEEVLGVTFDDPSMNIDTTVVRPELEKLSKRINSSIIDRIQHEWDEDRRSKIFLFPDEFANIFEKIGMFTDICFAQTRYRKSLMLRGIYFTSVPEEQQSRSTYLMNKNEDEKLNAARSNRGYFIKKLLRDVIFPESDLIKMDENYKKQNRKKQGGAIVAAVIAVFAFTLFWINDFLNHNQLLHDLENRVSVAIDKRDKLNSKLSYEKVLPLINEIEDIKNTYEEETSSWFFRLNFFSVTPRTYELYNIYHSTLYSVLMPKVEDSLSHRILSNLRNYDKTWSNTELYLMLNDEEHRKKDYLMAAMGSIWAKMYPNKPAVQRDLNKHFKNILDMGFEPYKLDKSTLKTARKVLYNKANVVIIYDELKKTVEDTMSLKPFIFEQVLGANVNVFKGDNYQIPGLYTKKGFEQVIIAKGEKLVKDITQNNWVLGTRTDLNESELNEIYSQILSLYFKEYKNYWLKAISAITVPKLDNESELRNQLEVLSLSNSPIVFILQALKENTNIYTPQEILLQKAQKGNAAIKKVVNAIKPEKKENSKLIVNIKTVRAFFKPYHNLLKPDGTPTINLENAMLVLNQVFQLMNEVYASVDPSEKSFEVVTGRINGKISPIVQTFTGLPYYVDKYLEEALSNNWNYLMIQMKKYVQNKYEKELYTYYQNKIENRYPFENSEEYVKLDDFKSFFQTNGIVDNFFKKYIDPFVQINKVTYKTYKSNYIDGIDANFDLEFMRAILQATRIRNLFFDEKGENLVVNFFLTPKYLESNMATMEFNYENYRILYEHGATRDMQLQWPAKDAKMIQEANFRLYDIQSEKAVDKSANGDWALFRLFDQLTIDSESDELMNVNYEEDDINKASIAVKSKIGIIYNSDKLFDNFRLNGEI